ncbi:hypothetical protein HID58_094814 [Brassica napus]|uniref:Thaumatin-like protein n=1 Tax=Brassica napus TaxID=3708 RepID=A0ABQ7X5Z8_BRANA|nr:hypothetical protein HID58_094814 [Brassica napus]
MGQSQNSLFLFLLLVFIYGVSSTTFTVINQCSYTVWPGLLSGAGTAPLPTTGFSLNPTETRVIPIPAAWSGRIWGRTLCTQDAATGKFTCVTGDCGSSAVECSGSGAAPPATLAEFTLNGAGGLDFYDVSLVDGYNIPMTIVPQGGVSGNCTTTGCVAELNGPCPAQLKVATTGTEGVACKSACEAVKSATKGGGLETEAVSYSAASPNASPTLSTTVSSIGVLVVAFRAVQRLW